MLESARAPFSSSCCGFDLPHTGWTSINWHRVRKEVRKLQRRIRKAASARQTAKVVALQRQLVRSRSARLLAVKRVAETNRGKNTPGVDGVAYLSADEKLDLAEALDITSCPEPLRALVLEKAGKARTLLIPTLHDRGAQTLARFALEAEWARSMPTELYGCQGRGREEAFQDLVRYLRGGPVYAFKTDIRSYYPSINREAVLRRVRGARELRRAIQLWIEAPVLRDGGLQPRSGIPQGAPISPLLGNLVLRDLIEVLRVHFGDQPRPAAFIYVDDLVLIHSDLEVVERGAAVVRRWIEAEGLELGKNKTSLVHTADVMRDRPELPGFSFLGVEFSHYGTPSSLGLTYLTAGRETAPEDIRQQVKRLYEVSSREVPDVTVADDRFQFQLPSAKLLLAGP
jgi:RNA-directed DNA polymerase